MNQKETMEQAINYLQNLNIKNQLKVANNIIDNLSNVLYNNDNVQNSNQLNTCYLIIKNILENSNI